VRLRATVRHGAGFGGRPPFAPFARAASALAGERAFPPFRPSATAARFFLDKQAVRFVELDTFLDRGRVVGGQDAVGEISASCVGAFSHRQGFGKRRSVIAAVFFDVGRFKLDGENGVGHARNIPNRLGSVKC
jgi:hypothetical protein